MKRALPVLSAAIVAVIFASSTCFAAVGCTLNDPDRDVKRIFPQSTGYKTEFITIEETGGEKIKEEIEKKLGDKFDNVYETIDVPYAYYAILKGKEVIGHVHGVNQKGFYGGMQLILGTDPGGKIIGFYYQKISSPEAAKFRGKAFKDQFIGLTLADFYKSEDPNSKVAAIKDPSLKSHEDFKATIRGAKKNLILLDTFILNKKRDGNHK